MNIKITSLKTSVTLLFAIESWAEYGGIWNIFQIVIVTRDISLYLVADHEFFFNITTQVEFIILVQFEIF